VQDEGELLIAVATMKNILAHCGSPG
jgi:hypothetical protein